MRTITNQEFINTMVNLLADSEARDLIYKADHTISHRADPHDKEARDKYLEYRKIVSAQKCSYLEVINQMVGPYDCTTVHDIRYAATERARDTAAYLLASGQVFGVRNSAEAVKAELETTRI